MRDTRAVFVPREGNTVAKNVSDKGSDADSIECNSAVGKEGYISKGWNKLLRKILVVRFSKNHYSIYCGIYIISGSPSDLRKSLFFHEGILW